MKRFAARSCFVLLVGLFGISLCIAQTPISGYHLLKKFEVGGEGGWDYLFADSAAHRVYVSRSTRVIVLDSETGAAIGEIPNTNGVHGIAIAEDLGRGFTSNGRDNSVTIFDLKTLKSLGTVATGKNPDAIIYDAASKRVFAFNGGSSNATAIDAADGKVAGTIDLGGKPEFATSDGKGMVFVNIEDKSQVVAIDSHKLTVRTTTKFFLIRFNDIYFKSQNEQANSQQSEWIKKLEFIFHNTTHSPGCILKGMSDRVLVKALIEGLIKEHINKDPYHQEIIHQMVNTVISNPGHAAERFSTTAAYDANARTPARTNAML